MYIYIYGASGFLRATHNFFKILETALTFANKGHSPKPSVLPPLGHRRHRDHQAKLERIIRAELRQCSLRRPCDAFFQVLKQLFRGFAPSLYFPPSLPRPCPHAQTCVTFCSGLRPENTFLVLNPKICKSGIVLPRGLLTLTFRARWWQSQMADRAQGRREAKRLLPSGVLWDCALLKPCRPYGSALRTPAHRSY